MRVFLRLSPSSCISLRVLIALFLCFNTIEQCFSVKKFIATTLLWFIDSQHFHPLTFLFFMAFLQWQVVTGMEAENIIESLVNYIWFLRVPNAVCISHLLLINRGTPVDLWRHKCAFLFTFNLEKLIIVVNSIKRIRATTCLGLTSETMICKSFSWMH